MRTLLPAMSRRPAVVRDEHRVRVPVRRRSGEVSPRLAFGVGWRGSSSPYFVFTRLAWIGAFGTPGADLMLRPGEVIAL